MTSFNKSSVPRFSGKSSRSSLISQLAAARLEALKANGDIKPVFNGEPYQCHPETYAAEVLGVTPWPGMNGKKGQLELFRDIGESVRAQLAGEPAQKVFHVEAGHGVGKTYGAAALVNWFFDCFVPSITMTTAPTAEQVEKLLWKNIKSMRPEYLPGRVLPSAPHMERGHNHFAYGRTTNNSGGQGTSRFQGQHDDFLFFVLDEAEGIPAFVFDAVDAMMTGGRVLICLMIANPLTRSSAFHRKGKEPGVARYRLSVLDFPNVVLGREVIKGGTSRDWVNGKILKHCQVVAAHNEDDHTFQIGWDVTDTERGRVLPAGTIFMPDAEFMFRVMGLPPKNLSSNTLITVGRYEAAQTRVPDPSLLDPTRVRYGVDVARDGDDVGTIWRLFQGVAMRIARLAKLDSVEYLGALKDDFLKVRALGAKDCQVRVDGGGGFGSGVVDGLRNDLGLQGFFEQELRVFEAHNNGTPYDDGAYADLVTEMYAQAGEALKGIRLENPPAELERDLTERTYKWVTNKGKAVKRLTPKADFKKNIGRSPDDGDGFVLCTSPDFLFEDPAPFGEAFEQHFDLESY